MLEDKVKENYCSVPNGKNKRSEKISLLYVN